MSLIRDSVPSKSVLVGTFLRPTLESETEEKKRRRGDGRGGGWSTEPEGTVRGVRPRSGGHGPTVGTGGPGGRRCRVVNQGAAGGVRDDERRHRCLPQVPLGVGPGGLLLELVTCHP